MSFINGIYNISVKIYKLIMLNLLWIIFVCRGFIIFGLYPATVAMFSVIRQLDKSNGENIYKMFRKYFHQEFKISNAIGLPSLMVVYLLLVGYRYLSLGAQPIYVSVSYFVLIALIMLIIHTTYLFPIMSHYNFQKMSDYVKLPFIFGLGYIGRTIIIFVVLGITHYTLLQWSILIPFIGISLNVYIVYFLTKGLLQKHPI